LLALKSRLRYWDFVNQLRDERIIYRCKLHWGIFLIPVASALVLMIPGFIVNLGPWFSLSLVRLPPGMTLPQMTQWNLTVVLVPALIGGGVMLMFVLIAYLKSEVVLTDCKLRFSAGLFSISTAEILLTRIETLVIREPLNGRLVGYGTVAVIGVGGTVFSLRFLPQPEKLYGLLQGMISPAQSPNSPKPKDVSQDLADIHSRYIPKE